MSPRRPASVPRAPGAEARRAASASPKRAGSGARAQRTARARSAAGAADRSPQETGDGSTKRASARAAKRASGTAAAGASGRADAAAGPATRNYHPARRSDPGRSGRAREATAVTIPRDTDNVTLEVGGRGVKLTNLRKVFWPELGLTKGDLLQYYADVAPVLLPHVRDRAMVMKRYPNGITGEFFFMKRTPETRPEWLETCAIEHASGNVIHFPIVQDVAALLWVINLGCIDLNQWYARCDDVDRPDSLHFDLDPGERIGWPEVVEAAQRVHQTLDALGMPDLVKTTGSRGVHVYVPIVRGPTQQEVWEIAKTISTDLARRHASVLTAVYARAKRPTNRVLVDYNQNAWGRTLASIYSPRPRPLATVSTPVTWDELARGATTDDFRIDNVRERIAARGDLWAPLLADTGRFDLERLAG